MSSLNDIEAHQFWDRDNSKSWNPDWMSWRMDQVKEQNTKVEPKIINAEGAVEAF